MVEFDGKMYDKILGSQREPWLWRIAHNLWLRDRTVLYGLLCSLVPLPPIALLGIIIAVANLWRLGLGRLDAGNGALVRVSLVLSLASLALGIVLTALAMQGWGQA